MKPPTGIRIRLLFLLCLVLSLTGCGNTEKKQVKNAVISGFGQLKDLNPSAVQEYLASESLFPDASTSQASAAVIEETMTQFFRYFDYDIKKVRIRGNTATCELQITTLDADALAKDYQERYLIQIIMAAANGQVFTDTSLEQHYLLLNQLMQSNTYDTVSSPCELHLIKSDKHWAIQKDRALENQLVGGFISAIGNPYLLAPAETVDIYLRTLKGMDMVQMVNYLGLANLLNNGSDNNQALANALLAQLRTCFNYRVTTSEDNGTLATVLTEITSFSSKEILSQYRSKLAEYLATPNALIAGPEGRLARSNDLLLDCITSNTATQSQTVPLSLINDGMGWKLQPNSQLGTALFGDFSDFNSDDMESSSLNQE